MSYERRNKKRKFKSYFRISIIAFIFIYLAFRSVPIFLANNTKTILPMEEVLVQKISSQGVIIKDEVVYKAQGSGQLDSSIKEGERVPAGIEVATINLLEDTSHLKLELIELENAIKLLSITDKDIENIENEKNQISEKQADLVENIQIAINLGQYDLVNATKLDLTLYDTKDIDILVSDKLLNTSIDELKEKKVLLEEEINKNNIKYFTSNAGIVSYLIDGYESVYLPNNFQDYTYENLIMDLEPEKNKRENDINQGSAVFKMIDNFQWYIGLKIEDSEQIIEYEVGNNIRIQFENDEKELIGNIISINPSNDKAVVIIKLKDYLHEYYNLRFANVDIIKSKKQSLKIPTKVIIDKDGQKGVYIREINGIVKFRPISIISEDEDYTFVEKGDSKNQIKITGLEDMVKTISLYDEIFTVTNNIKEGQILN